MNKGIILDVVRTRVASCTSHVLLAALETKQLNVDTWRRFAIERYKAGVAFKDLLIQGIKQSKAAGLVALVSTIQANLNDELGIVDGVQYPALVHEQWRRDCYNAMGINTDTLAMLPAMEGTIFYLGSIQALIEWGSAFHISGALLFLELQISMEFKHIRKGRDLVFRDQFVDHPNDDTETRERKHRARLYIDDHIDHDAKDHFPKLLKAITATKRTTRADTEIVHGIEMMSRAKTAFYDSLANELIENT